MRKRTLLSPAKINLSLRVTGRRVDGYHLIESLFVPVTLFDDLEITFARRGSDSTIEVTSTTPQVPSGSANLIFRAADIMRRRSGRSFSLTVRLIKRIPVGSGLGGGSSNAATILGFLNWALDSPFDHSTLATLGSEIGADVSFFVHCKPAIIRGVGESVEPLPILFDACFVLCSPETALSTAMVYAQSDRLSRRRQSTSLTTRSLESNIADFVSGHRPLTDLLVNDLEEAAAQICPDVRRLKSELLNLGAQGASMTGSGSAVFGVCPDAESAQSIAAALRRKGFWACSTKALSASSI
jgi:4-diphosphocytidyl-2-C-methyl-D-erythritol kinase